MRISVFTPSHDPKYLNECLHSMLDQSFEDWEWVVMLNGGAQWSPSIDDPRVKVYHNDLPGGVGAQKKSAVAKCEGELLVELDHDDMLIDVALEQLWAAYETDLGAGMYYSQSTQMDADGGLLETSYGEDNGWTYRVEDIDDVKVQYAVSMEPTPHNVSLIWYAPNHVRAFTRVAYDAVGGYDETLDILDDQDLMSRLYQYGKFVLLDTCLYLQRFHANNTQLQSELNARIQTETVEMYEKYLEDNALAWSRRHGLLALDLGGAHGVVNEYYKSVDQHDAPGVDIVHTFPNMMDLPDSCVGVIRASDFLEHVVDKVGAINEIYRLLAPGGLLLSNTPSTDGRGAFQDPTHVAFYNQNSFWYYTEPMYRNFVPELECKFQVSRLRTYWPSQWHYDNQISYVQANLIAIKEGSPIQGGVNYWR